MKQIYFLLIFYLYFSGNNITIKNYQDKLRRFQDSVDSITFDAYKYYTGTFAYRNYSIPDTFITEFGSLYISKRELDSNMSSFKYHIPVANVHYNVRLHFAEIYWGATGGDIGGAGSRIFNVHIEENQVLNNFDIAAEAGVMTALVKTFSVSVSDDTLDLDFIPVKNRGKISAIEIFPQGSIPLAVNQKEKPERFRLYQNYPNPFNPVTKIKFSIPSKVKGERSKVRLIVYDLLGREIATLVNEDKPEGEFEVDFNGSTYTSGVYLYKLEAGEFTESKKLLIMK